MSGFPNGSRLRRLLLKTPGGRGAESAGINKFIREIPSEDRRTVARWIHHEAAYRDKPQPEAETERVDRHILSQTKDELRRDVREIVESAKLWWAEHREHLAKSGMSCNLMGCRRR